jgi:hypothetical protein
LSVTSERKTILSHRVELVSSVHKSDRTEASPRTSSPRFLSRTPPDS